MNKEELNEYIKKEYTRRRKRYLNEIKGKEYKNELAQYLDGMLDAYWDIYAKLNDISIMEAINLLQKEN